MRSSFESGVEIRDSSGGKLTITGLIPFWNEADSKTECELSGNFRERIMPTAFDKMLLSNEDVVANAFHRNDMLLGRRSAGTLRFEKLANGLRYEVDLPDTTDAKNIVESIRRRDLTGSSFVFKFRDSKGSSFTDGNKNGIVYRNLHDIKVLEVGPVSWPAYQASTAGVRSATSDDVRIQYDVYKKLQEINEHENAARQGKTAN